MNAHSNFQHSNHFYSGNDETNYRQGFQGNPELVNFPSTSEIFHAVLENSFYANFIGNGEGKTLEANETVCRVFGYTTDEMTRLTTKDLFDTTEKNYKDYLFQRKSYGRAKAQITAIRKSGEHFACEITSLIYVDDTGERRSLNTIIDISKNYSRSLFD
ncbi:PAS domain S-box protein [Ginsengibacter hankyongi]|uniref:PAS domain S-box protein n=1 Tax=Ginsengibacter hankyongi TaxID=2607284 RepID=A0A5J5IBA4_9BACT|nr:PAS domain-containing protein [Ginsengibacter hankyongi]KAA9035467.1 PAS domain S-box protein [Ginsengibacter hankyongi]